MDRLPTNIDELQALVRQLFDENARLRARVAELEARMKQDSQNSHQPPSRDGYRKRPALPKPAGRKRGGQPAHGGNTLRLVDDPDHTIACRPVRCSCGASFDPVAGTVLERRQVFDLPDPKLEVTEYQRLRCQCPTCGKTQDGQFPEHVQAPTQYGDGVRALATLLNTPYKLPFRKIQRLFADLFGYAINEGTLVTANTRCYTALAPSEVAIKAHLLASPVCHFDETGLRVAGTLQWEHVASNATATYLFVHPKRGHEALDSDASLFPAYQGWAIHDGWRSYFQHRTCRHGLCGAHLLRELTAVIEQGRRWAAHMHRFLRALYRHSAAGTSRVQHPQRWSRLYDRLCLLAQREEPPPKRHSPKGKATRTKGRNLLERLIVHKSAVLAFAFFPEVPFTNNQAERDLRDSKVKQRIAGSFRTRGGADHYARITSFVATARKQHRHVFTELRRIFQGTSYLLESGIAK
jgi:transposase